MSVKRIDKNRVKIYEKGGLVEESDATLEDLMEALQNYIDSKLQELIQQYEIEVTIDPASGRGVGKFKKKPS